MLFRGMLLDSLMPSWDVAMRHEMVVGAPREAAYAAARRVDFMASPITRLLFLLRGLGGRGPLALDDAPRWGFDLLGEDPGTEFVVGTVGHFWRIRPDRLPVGATAFRSRSFRGTAKAALSFRIEPIDATHSRVITETRVVCADEASLRSFRRYWRLIRPFSALIRRLVLARIKADAERAALGEQPNGRDGSHLQVSRDRRS